MSTGLLFPSEVICFAVGLSAANLRCKVFGSNPDPYIKLVVIPGARLPKLHHHGQLKVLPSCSNTVHPRWNNTVSKFCVY